MKLKKGDKVIVMAGKDKGKTGKIVRVLRDSGRVLVDGLNQMKRHQKQRRQGEQGQILTFSASINASNVMIVDPSTGKPSRIGKKKVGDKMVRITRRSGDEI